MPAAADPPRAPAEPAAVATAAGMVASPSAPVGTEPLPTPEARDLDALNERGSDAGTALTVAGERAYLAQRDMVHLLNVRDPKRPRWLSDVQALIDGPVPLYPVVDMDVRDGPVALALGEGGLYLLDVTGDRLSRATFPAASTAGAYPAPTAPRIDHVAIRGDRVYGSGDSLFVFDVSDSSRPLRTGEIRLASPALDIAVFADTLYVLTRGGVWLYDVLDPGDPSGSLYFLDLATGQVCRHDEVQAYMYESGEPLGWSPDGRHVAVVVTKPAGSPEELVVLDAGVP